MSSPTPPQTRPHEHGHGHGRSAGGPSDPRLIRLLTAVVVPAVVASLIGMVLLWPSPKPSNEALGAFSVERGVVRSSTLVACEGTTDIDDVDCLAYEIELETGIDDGQTTVVEMPATTGTITYTPGQRLVLSRVEPCPDESWARSPAEDRKKQPPSWRSHQTSRCQRCCSAG